MTNSWLVTVVEGTAETIALAQGSGVDPQHFLDAVSGGPLDSPYMAMKAEAMIKREFEPSFKLSLAAKDAGLAEELAQHPAWTCRCSRRFMPGWPKRCPSMARRTWRRPT